MNANAVTKHYGNLTAEERFRLILAAGGRGDEAERDRLAKVGGRITLSMPDHSPYAQAFDDLSWMTFIELLEEAAGYNDLFQRWAEIFESTGPLDGAEAEDEAEDDADEEADEVEGAETEESGRDRALDLALAAGYILRTKADGWKLFCERMTVPPFLLWQRLPGFDRLQRALKLAERVAFVEEGMLRWLNWVRPAGEPEITKVPFTAERVAAGLEELYRDRVRWWGG